MLRIVVLFYCLGLAGSSFAQVISTVAGNGSGAYLGNNVLAISTSIGQGLEGLAFDDSNNYYFTLGQSYQRICKVTNSGLLQIIAGNGILGFSGDGGPATSAMLRGPAFIAVNKFGNIYFSDEVNCRIRVINRGTGIINTIAGNGTPGYGGDGGPATAAMLYYPTGICFDSIGNLYIADADNFRIRMVDSNGIIHPFAGNGVNGYSGDGGPADSAAMGSLLGLCVDRLSNIYVSEGIRICKIDATTRRIIRIAGNGIVGNTGDGGPADSASLGAIYHITFNREGELFLSDGSGLSVIRRIDTNGYIHHVAGIGVVGYNGDGIAADTAIMSEPRGIAFDACGNLFLCDNGNFRIRKITFDTSCNSLTLNVHNVAPLLKILVYPNPAAETLHIDGLQTPAKYRLMNMVGAIMEEGRLNAGGNNMPMAGLPTGVYVLVITDETGNKEMSKIIRE